MRLVSASLQTITQLSDNKSPQKTISAWAKQQSARRAMQIWVWNNWTAAYYHILKDIATLNPRKSHLKVHIKEIKQSQLAYHSKHNFFLKSSHQLNKGHQLCHQLNNINNVQTLPLPFPDKKYLLFLKHYSYNGTES